MVSLQIPRWNPLLNTNFAEIEQIEKYDIVLSICIYSNVSSFTLMYTFPWIFF